jgi:ATP-dependent DNA helicase PIF1
MLIISDASVASAELFDALEYLARSVRKIDHFFGGICVVLDFDLMQLEPISKPPNMCEPLFHSAHWENVLLKQSVLLPLARQHRYARCSRLQVLVDAVRHNCVTDQQHRQIEALSRTTTSPGAPRPVVLCPKREGSEEQPQVKEHCQAALKRLPGNGHDFPCYRVSIDSIAPLTTPPGVGGADGIGNLKVGARVMYPFNDRAARLTNGSLGMVVAFRPPSRPSPFASHPVVRWDGQSAAVEILPVPEEVVERVVIDLPMKREMYVYIPLIVAEALTIHKSIGMTLPSVILDCGTGLFCFHQLTEALSRVPSIDRLQVTCA